MRSSPPRVLVLLPLILLAVMMGLGLAIEAARFHTLFWATKVPLAFLLAVGFFHGARER